MDTKKVSELLLGIDITIANIEALIEAAKKNLEQLKQDHTNLLIEWKK